MNAIDQEFVVLAGNLSEWANSKSTEHLHFNAIQ
jgi:hypothetical protein